MLITLGRGLHPRARNFSFPFLTRCLYVCLRSCVYVGIHTPWHLVTCPDSCVQTSPVTTRWEGPPGDQVYKHPLRRIRAGGGRRGFLPLQTLFP